MRKIYYKMMTQIDFDDLNKYVEKQEEITVGHVLLQINDLFKYLNNNARYVAEIILPLDAVLIKDPDSKERLICNKIIIENVYNLYDEDTFRILLSKGADINAGCYSALNWACKNGHNNILEVLMENRVKASDIYNIPFINACKNGHFDVVKNMIKYGININNEDDIALRCACEYGNFETVKYLLENGADVNAKYSKPIQLASRNGHAEIVEHLIKHDANAMDDYSLEWSVKNGHIDVVKHLLKNGSYVNQNRILDEACETGNLEIIKCLIDHKAKITTDVLNKVCLAGNLQIVKLFLENKADIKFYDTYGNKIDVLKNACENFEIIKCLIEHKAKITTDSFNKVCENGNLQIVKFFVENKANINANNGQALDGPVSKGHMDVVKYLVENDIDINIITATNGSFEMMRYLLENLTKKDQSI